MSYAESSRRWREKHPERYKARQERQLAKPGRPNALRRQHLRRTYGLTVEAYDALFEAQDGRCAICREAEKEGGNLPVDHDHRTGLVRGLLCQKCNRAIGLLKDSAELCARASSYLKRE